MAVTGEARWALRGQGFAPPRRFLATLSDERLAERLRKGNGLAFELLYDRHHLPLLGYCRHLLRSPEEAEDAVQQVFMSAHRALTEKGDAPARVKPWLYTIARNRCLSMMREHKDDVRQLEDRLAMAGPGPSEKVEEQADLEGILSDVRQLPEAQRTALVLTELGGLSHPEVAEVLDCEHTKVKALVFQGRATLIEQRAAREASCHEVREEIANMSGSRLRGRPRRHVKSCDACAAFAHEVRNQRQLLALALPVAPSVGLKRSVLAATTGVGGGGSLGGGGGLVAGAALKAGGVGSAGGAGGVAASGGAAAAGTGAVAAVATHAGVAKAAAVALAAGSVATGVSVGHDESRTARSPSPTGKEERQVEAGGAESNPDRRFSSRQDQGHARRQEGEAERAPGRSRSRGSPPDHAASEQSRPSSSAGTGPSPASGSAETRGNSGSTPSRSQNSRSGSQSPAGSGQQTRQPTGGRSEPDGVRVPKPRVPEPVRSVPDTATQPLEDATPLP